MSLTVYISNLEQVPKLKSKSVALIFHHFCDTKLYAHVLQFRVHTLILNTFHKIAHLEEIASWTVIGPDIGGVTHQSITIGFGLRHIRLSHLVLGLHTLDYHTWSRARTH